MPGIDYKEILDVEYGIEPQQQQGRLERSIAEWRGVPEQQQQQQEQSQLYAGDKVQRPQMPYQRQ